MKSKNFLKLFHLITNSECRKRSKSENGNKVGKAGDDTVLIISEENAESSVLKIHNNACNKESIVDKEVGTRPQKKGEVNSNYYYGFGQTQSWNAYKPL